jgi:hypothetical protein
MHGNEILAATALVTTRLVIIMAASHAWGCGK